MSNRAPVLFHEEQPLRQRYAKLALATPPLALIFVTCRQLVWHHPLGNPPISNGDLLFLTILLTVVYVRLITVRLVTELRPTEIDVGLGGLWRKRRISLHQVRTAKAVEYDAMRDFGGYGVRSGLRGRCVYRVRIARRRAGIAGWAEDFDRFAESVPSRQRDLGVAPRSALMNVALSEPARAERPEADRSSSSAQRTNKRVLWDMAVGLAGVVYLTIVLFDNLYSPLFGLLLIGLAAYEILEPHCAKRPNETFAGAWRWRRRVCHSTAREKVRR